MKKRMLALLMAICMVLGLAACGSSSESAAAEESAASVSAAEETTEAAEEPAEAAAEEPAAEAETEEAASAVEETAEPVEVPDLVLPLSDGSETFSVWVGINPGAMNYITSLAENMTVMELMERTGVNLEFIHFHPDTQTEQFNLVCASGDYPDVMSGVANAYSGGADQGIDDEVFIDHLEYMEEYAPHYYSIISADSELYDAVTTAEGRAVGFYSLYEEARLNDTGYVIRQDYLDDLGLDMPSTYDELHDALSQMKESYGTSDALFIPSTGISDAFIAGYGVGSGMYVDGDTIKYGPLEEGFKEYLQMMADWYSEDLIYHDFPYYGEQLNFRDNGLIGDGSVVCFRSETGDMASYAGFSDNADFLVTAMAPLSEEEGGTVYICDQAPSRADDLRWSITTGCEDPELLMQFIDYMYTDEGSLLCNYGIEGETFDYDENGTPQFSDMINNNPDYDYRTAVYLYVMDNGPFVVDPMRGTASYTQEQLDSWDAWVDADLDYSHVMPAKVSTKAEDAEYNNIMSDIETFMDEYTVKYVTGELSFDTYEADFVEQLKSMNVERAIELYQDAYDYYYAG